MKGELCVVWKHYKSMKAKSLTSMRHMITFSARFDIAIENSLISDHSRTISQSPVLDLNDDVDLEQFYVVAVTCGPRLLDVAGSTDVVRCPCAAQLQFQILDREQVGVGAIYHTPDVGQAGVEEFCHYDSHPFCDHHPRSSCKRSRRGNKRKASKLKVRVIWHQRLTRQ